MLSVRTVACRRLPLARKTTGLVEPHIWQQKKGEKRRVSSGERVVNCAGCSFSFRWWPWGFRVYGLVGFEVYGSGFRACSPWALEALQRTS